jgi:hypothetical protein
MPKVPVLAGRQSGLAGANLDLPANSVGTPVKRPPFPVAAKSEKARAPFSFKMIVCLVPTQNAVGLGQAGVHFQFNS